MRILVTGSKGFLGKYLLEELKLNGHEVGTLSREKGEPREKRYSLDLKTLSEDIDRAIGSFRPDYIFHLAGTTDSKDLSLMAKVNIEYAIQIMSALDKFKLKEKCGVILLGSAAEYGVVMPEDLPVREDRAACPYNLYGASKLAQTSLGLAWGRLGGRLMVVRPFTLIGKGMPEHLSLGSFATQINKITDTGGYLNVGDLDSSRDFLDVSDAAKLLYLLSKNESSYGKIINLCSGRSIRIKEVVSFMIEKSGKKITIKMQNDRLRPMDMREHFGCHKQLLTLTGDFSFRFWQESVREMVE